jgi:hypothetical protein
MNRQIGPLGANLPASDPRNDGGNPVRLDGLDISAFDPRHRNVEAVPGVNNPVKIKAGFHGAESAHVSSIY